MHTLLEEVFKTKTYKNSRNEIIPIHSETSREQCLFLQDLIRQNKFKHSIEIGFAYGMSTLAILEEIAKNNGRHVVIDKFQIDGWGGHGLDMIKQAGYEDKLEFSDKFCYQTLPELMLSGRTFDFAYIDSTKQFDWLLVDFFYIDKILEVGGIIVFDDVTFPGIRKLLRYISQFPAYKIESQHPGNAPVSKRRRMAHLLKNFPGAKSLLRPEILVSDFEMGLNANCVALRKVQQDTRSWDWHVDF